MHINKLNYYIGHDRSSRTLNTDIIHNKIKYKTAYSLGKLLYYLNICQSVAQLCYDKKRDDELIFIFLIILSIASTNMAYQIKSLLMFARAKFYV